MLARAIVGAPRLLLIDAALDTLDSRSAGSLMDLLENRDAPWTLVVVSNRRKILDRCDRVVDLSALRVSGQEAVS
jgi:ABC-type bacteriocin/lantibiotic exporter with double-glycine peptidase domain